MKGKFVTFEGCDGCGKSSQMRMLAEYLTVAGRSIVMTREPGGSVVSDKIRDILLDAGNYGMEPETEALLFAASRVQHYREFILPALNSGLLVLCDRYIDSSLAYQGFGRGLGFDFVLKLFESTLADAMPDLTVFIDVPPTECFDRKGGVDENDRIERAGGDFFDKVYEGYMEAAKKFPQRIAIIKAEGTKLETQEKIRELLRSRGIIK